MQHTIKHCLGAQRLSVRGPQGQVSPYAPRALSAAAIAPPLKQQQQMDSAMGVKHVSQYAKLQPLGPSSGPIAPQITALNPWEFDEFMTSAGKRLVLIDYYTDWCGPCKMMEPEFQKLRAAFTSDKVVFAKFNVGLPGAHTEFATQQRIRTLPTFRLYQGGRMVEQVTGAKPMVLRQMVAEQHFTSLLANNARQ